MNFDIEAINMDVIKHIIINKNIFPVNAVPKNLLINTYKIKKIKEYINKFTKLKINLLTLDIGIEYIRLFNPEYSPI